MEAKWGSEHTSPLLHSWKGEKINETAASELYPDSRGRPIGNFTNTDN